MALTVSSLPRVGSANSYDTCGSCGYTHGLRWQLHVTASKVPRGPASLEIVKLETAFLAMATAMCILENGYEASEKVWVCTLSAKVRANIFCLRDQPF